MAGRRRSGVALLFVLWMMAILSSLALQLSFSSRLRLQSSANVGSGTKALFLARAGVERAIVDALEGRNSIQYLADLREDETRPYRNVELGDGTYTLYAGMDDSGLPAYGLMDEAGKVNLNTAGTDVLAKVPGIEADFAARIEARRRLGEFKSLEGLLQVEGIDALSLYGEDQNGNGIMDANENDGNESWPPDNADDKLDAGLAGYLTVWSASRNVTADGQKRVNINSASAENIQSSVSGVTAQEAESIVEYRKGKTFTTVADLLDVDLMEKTAEPPRQSDSGGQGGQEGSSQSRQGRGGSQGSQVQVQRGASGNEGQQQQQATYRSTGKKAFDESRLKSIADYVTTTDDQVIKGAVNINTAPQEVLACLPGLDDATAREIVRWRAEKGGFKTAADLLDVRGVTTASFKQFCGNVSARSDVLSVRSFGVISAGEVFRCVEAVIDRTDETAAVRSWREMD